MAKKAKRVSREKEPLNELDTIASAAAAFREPGGLPWAEKMEVSRENWRKLVRLILEMSTKL
jgi:hypothetical protein